MVFVSGVLFVGLSVLPVRALADGCDAARPQGRHGGGHWSLPRLHCPAAMPASWWQARRRWWSSAISPRSRHVGGDCRLLPDRGTVRAAGSGGVGDRHAGDSGSRLVDGASRVSRGCIPAALARPGASRTRHIGGIEPDCAMTIVLAMLLVDVFDTPRHIGGRGCSRPPARCRRAGCPGFGARFWPTPRRRFSAAWSAPLPPPATSRAPPGVESGGRTGLTAVVVAALFLACLLAGTAGTKRAGVCLCRSVALRGLLDGTQLWRPRMGRRAASGSGGDHGHLHPAQLLHRRRHRHRLHHLCRDSPVSPAECVSARSRCTWWQAFSR